MTNPADLSLAGASSAIAAGELSPLELTTACLARARRTEPELNAFVTLDPDGALAHATALTEELAQGRTRGPLHGIPLGIKDLIDVAGLPTTASSKVLSDHVAATDAPVVACLRDGGAVMLGKTNTQEFAYGVVSAPTRNPWDPERIPGGSSGGSGAALAAGLCSGALGTDTAGSIRIPAALCGVTGLKPAPGIVPVEGIIALAPSLDVCGPMARSAEDVELMWRVLAGAPAAGVRDPRALSIAAPEAFGDVVELDADVEAPVTQAVEDLVGSGARRVPVSIPHFSSWDRPRSIPLMTEALMVHKQAGWYPGRSGDYTPETIDNLRLSETFTAEDLISAYRELETLTAQLSSALNDADVLALPTVPITAPTHEQATERGDDERRPVVRTLTRICGPINYCRLAAVSVACGFNAGGLPVGLQLVARDEATALGAALLYQQLTDFHTRRPSAHSLRR